MKRIGSLFVVFGMIFFITGCGNGGEEADFIEHNKYNKAVECSRQYTASLDRYVIYFDSEDKIMSFDFYSTGSSENITDEQYNKVKEKQCGGQGNWPKETIEVCDFSNSNGQIRAHLYINTGKSFGNYNTKDDIMNLKPSSLKGFDCKVR